ncbi:hypothetical protein SAMN05421774_101381 [Gemmobacter megaterium]|uniref:Uncharacterized protein n=1 Tax=Gemmobacter megaterium TaxID=1086013 RepID=A0A1N7KET4_9RHOB|nr:DUF692 domain-containing protein [Gemmobacter megaterium]GGE01729.1 UPF0276 protein [Gemmobacter megaterium]SIS60029.1 hypothetical protein SAMN05421774_101381 [Gemmobacter megaterium]
MTLPARAGLGFKPQHFAQIVASPPTVGFFEVHAENYLGAGGAPHVMLETLHRDHALSVHGVGLSIGGDRIDAAHLARIKALCDRHQPESFSEHLAWSSHGNEFLNDLLPLPYTAATLDRVVAHVDQVQTALGRRLLLENPATYVVFADSDIPETEFLAQIAARSGCGLLLDVNNVFVSCTNHRTDPLAYLDAFPLHLVAEIHLGGHEAEDLPSGPLLIDSHGAEVADPVWALFAHVLHRTGPLPSLVEWDTDVPDWPVLMAEAQRAERVLSHEARHAAA